ncbi:preprotein translocase subunit SecE [bacterium]|nr:preprotein translocase subunit SecE [bacterium]|tara:strand:+ start:616 stop:795 length:180 start_codon:yes stop_codon:yes gene_type:complete
MNSLIKYLREARTELKKVVWPTRSETINHTILVIAISLVTAAFLGVVDIIFTELFQTII